MEIDIKKLLHPRIIKHCEKLFDDGHYKHAAFEAMKQVELAIKEKSGENNKYGVALTKSLFGQGKGIKLKIPFGDKLQKEADILFHGAFSYYRNYSAHNGTKITQESSARILIIASELLYLIGASSLSFLDVGGVEGLIKSGIFSNKESLIGILKFLDEYHILDNTVDGYFEDLYIKGFNEDQIQAVLELGLIEYKSEKYIPFTNETYPPDDISRFELTDIGKKIVGD